MKFATDKVEHGYLPSYLRIAAEIGPAGRVLEVGVWHGGSLHMWQALFPGGVVCGVDSDPGARWPPGTVAVVSGQDAAGSPGPAPGGVPAGLGPDRRRRLTRRGDVRGDVPAAVAARRPGRLVRPRGLDGRPGGHPVA